MVDPLGEHISERKCVLEEGLRDQNKWHKHSSARPSQILQGQMSCMRIKKKM